MARRLVEEGPNIDNRLSLKSDEGGNYIDWNGTKAYQGAFGGPWSKQYVAVLHLTDVPDAIAEVDEFVNTIGPIVWSRFATGQWKGTLVDAFPFKQVFVTTAVMETMSPVKVVKCERASSEQVALFVYPPDGSDIYIDLIGDVNITILVSAERAKGTEDEVEDEQRNRAQTEPLPKRATVDSGDE